MLHLLDKYSKSVIVSPTTPSEGTSFAQQGGQGSRGANRSSTTYDKNYWKDKDCFNCNKKGHPSSHCPDKAADKRLKVANRAKHPNQARPPLLASRKHRRNSRNHLPRYRVKYRSSNTKTRISPTQLTKAVKMHHTFRLAPSNISK
jgi:hypothetical protein